MTKLLTAVAHGKATQTSLATLNISENVWL